MFFHSSNTKLCYKTGSLCYRFQKMEAGLQKDLEALKNGLRHNDPVPRFHYENRTFSMVQYVHTQTHLVVGNIVYRE